MFKEYRDSYITKYSSPFAAYLADGDDVCSWGDVDGPALISWIGGRHILVHHNDGYVEHVLVPEWDGWKYLDRPARSTDINGAYVWSWIEHAYPGVAAWELDEDEGENE